MIDLNSTFFVQILNFAVLLLILKKFAWGPLLKTLQERSDKIADNIRSADEDRAQAAELKKEYETQLADARRKAQEIMDAATKRSEEERQASVENTRHEIEQMKKAAQAQIQRDRDLAAKQLKGEMVAMSLAAASKLLAKQMDDEANAKLVGDFINELEKDKIGDLPC